MGLSLRKQSTPGALPPGALLPPPCQIRKEGGLPQSRPGRSLIDKGFFYPRVLREEVEPPHSRQRPGMQPAYRGYSQMPWIRYCCPPALSTGPPLPRSLGLSHPSASFSLKSLQPQPRSFSPSGTFSERTLSHLESLPCSGEGAPTLASELAPPHTPPCLSEGPLAQLSV